MPSSPRSYFPNGKPPKSACTLQKLFSTVLPNSNAPICRCIASFTHTLLELNLKTPSDKWMQPPSPSDLLTASNLPASILLHPIDNILPSATSKVTEKIPSIYHTLFIHDLNLSKFPGSTFAWDEPWEGNWNTLLSKFILKHWTHANQAGAFKAFHIDPTHSSNNLLQTGILHRWFIGRKTSLRLGQHLSQHIANKKKSQKKTKLRSQVSLEFTTLCIPLLLLTFNYSSSPSSRNTGKIFCQPYQSPPMKWKSLTSSSALQIPRSFPRRFSSEFP